MFWKKVNRGLILGAALLIFLIGFIVVKEVSFKREIPQIKEKAKAYLTELCALQCNVDGRLNEELSPEVKEAQKEKLAQLLKDDWYGNLPDDDYSGSGITEIQQAYDKYLDQAVRVLFSSVELHLSDSNMEVSKDGPDRAILILSNVTLAAEYRGDINWLFDGFFNGYYDTAFDSGSELNTGIYSFNLMRFEMQRVHGEWKIVGFADDGRYNGVAERWE